MNARSKDDEMKLLNYLSMDFPNLRRFILAAQQMERLTKSELAKKDAEVQAKFVSNIEIAKAALLEAGVNARPFMPCPAHLIPHRKSYLDALGAAQSLVPYISDVDVRLRLRRLLLSLSCTSRFRVSLKDDTRRGRMNGGASSALSKKPDRPKSPDSTSTISTSAKLNTQKVHRKRKRRSKRISWRDYFSGMFPSLHLGSFQVSSSHVSSSKSNKSGADASPQPGAKSHNKRTDNPDSNDSMSASTPSLTHLSQNVNEDTSLSTPHQTKHGDVPEYSPQPISMSQNQHPPSCNPLCGVRTVDVASQRTLRAESEAMSRGWLMQTASGRGLNGGQKYSAGIGYFSALCLTGGSMSRETNTIIGPGFAGISNDGTRSQNQLKQTDLMCTNRLTLPPGTTNGH